MRSFVVRFYVGGLFYSSELDLCRALGVELGRGNGESRAVYAAAAGNFAVKAVELTGKCNVTASGDLYSAVAGDLFKLNVSAAGKQIVKLGKAFFGFYNNIFSSSQITMFIF